MTARQGVAESEAQLYSITAHTKFAHNWNKLPHNAGVCLLNELRGRYLAALAASPGFDERDSYAFGFLVRMVEYKS